MTRLAPLALGLLALGVLAACGVGEPFEFTPDHELKPGPGLLSGEDGEFVLFRLPREDDGAPRPVPDPPG